ncbi:hypothetical protein AB0B56_06435 [Streptosporangium canum]|uniref:hypothetical protein n=1 Tax=Streptosporangium canum TaxID=324952 RepID=UPI0034269759
MITRTRLGVFLAATLGTAFTSVVAPTAVLAQQWGQTTTSASTTADSGKIRMNQIQFMGARNSFHREMQSVEPAEMYAGVRHVSVGSQTHTTAV